jgi:hypothetical protein
MLLASRQDPALRGADPRAWPFELSRKGSEPPPVPASAAVTLDAWPLLLTGSKQPLEETNVDPAAALRGMFWSYTRDFGKPGGLVGLPAGAIEVVEEFIGPIANAAREFLTRRPDEPSQLEAVQLRGRVGQPISRRLTIRNDEPIALRGRVFLTDWYGDEAVVNSQENISFDPELIDVPPAASHDVTVNVDVGPGFRAGSSYRAMLSVEGCSTVRIPILLHVVRSQGTDARSRQRRKTTERRTGSR